MPRCPGQAEGGMEKLAHLILAEETSAQPGSNEL